MSSLLPIVEKFSSLQGEGVHVGKSAYFIRLAGCNVECPWCDTKDSWQEKTHGLESITELSEEAANAYSKGASMLVITGGEPLQHNLQTLCEIVKNKTSTKNRISMPIHLETSGVYDLSGLINWITLSPKRHYHPKKKLLQMCDELKVVIHTKEDISFAEEMAKQAIEEKKNDYPKNSNSNRKLVQPHMFLQPGWKSEEGKKLAIEYIKSHPKWRLSLQVHKWIGLP